MQGVVAYISGQNPINIQVVLINASNAQHSAAHSKGGSGAVSLEDVLVMREETVACHADDVELACFCRYTSLVTFRCRVCLVGGLLVCYVVCYVLCILELASHCSYTSATYLHHLSSILV